MQPADLISEPLRGAHTAHTQIGRSLYELKYTDDRGVLVEIIYLI
jgi:hypothetical protein